MVKIREIVDALIEYQKYINQVKGNMIGVYFKGALLYLNDDDIPDLILDDDPATNSGPPALNDLYLLSYRNGQLLTKKIRIVFQGIYYTPKTETFYIKGDQCMDDIEDWDSYYQSYAVIKLTDVFEDLGFAKIFYSKSDAYEVNGEAVASQGEVDEYLDSFSLTDCLNYDNLAKMWDGAGGETSLLELYDTFTTTFTKAPG